MTHSPLFDRAPAPPVVRALPTPRTSSPVRVVSPLAGTGRSLALIARRLIAAEDLAALLTELVDSVPMLFDSAGHVCATAVERGTVVSVAATDDVARRWDDSQYEVDEGPTVAVARGEADTVVMPDLAGEQRWPRWRAALADQAAGASVGSLVAYRLDAGTGALGTLTLYSGRPRAFAGGTVAVGSALALHAAAAMAAVSKRANLQVALESRDVIGQAKGVLMERHRITADEAFDLLVGASQRTNRKVRDVADELATTGALVVERDVRL